MGALFYQCESCWAINGFVVILHPALHFTGAFPHQIVQRPVDLGSGHRPNPCINSDATATVSWLFFFLNHYWFLRLSFRCGVAGYAHVRRQNPSNSGNASISSFVIQTNRSSNPSESHP